MDNKGGKMAKNEWTAENIPSQQGKIILITGANSGLGLEATRVLSAKDAHVIMAVRNMNKGKEAASKIREEYPKSQLELMHLDLADFDSIRKFSEEFHSKHSKLDVLINNAGVMSPPRREATKQNFELQFGTNHLGHFLLTGLLLNVLKNTHNSRITVQSSLVHKTKFYKADIHFDDLNWENSYNKNQSYSQSKLANLLFAYELDRRLKRHNIQTIVTAAHPGYSSTNLQKNFGFFVSLIGNSLIAQSARIGALPILRASTEEGLKGSEYFGPTRMGETRGYPEKVQSSDKSYNEDLARKLWDISEKLTGISYNFEE